MFTLFPKVSVCCKLAGLLKRPLPALGTCIILLAGTFKTAKAADPYAYWLMPGFNYQISERRYAFAQLGWNPKQKLLLVYGNFIIRPRPNFDINLGAMYIDYLERETREGTLMNGITARIPVGSFLIENRSLIWNRFVYEAPDLHFFRNRVRFMRSFHSALQLTPYVFDEPSYSFNRGDISRNRLGAGCVFTIRKQFTVDVSYARQTDKVSGPLNLFFILLTAQVPQKRHR